MSAHRYIILATDGNEYGPVDADALKTWVAENRVNAKTLLRREADNVQMQAGVFSELGHLFPAPLATGADGAGTRAATPAAPVPGSGTALPQGAVPPGSPLWSSAILTVVAGLCSLALFGVPALIFAIVALLKATQANSYYQAGNTPAYEQSAAAARKWTLLGWIALPAIFVIALLVAFATGVAASLLGGGP